MNKPISSLTQTALDLKANLSSPTFTGTVNGITKSMVGLSNVDNTTDSNKPISSLTQTALNLKANLNNPTFTGTVNGITKSMVGLSSVDNKADLNKPISTATQTALDLKVNLSALKNLGSISSTSTFQTIYAITQNTRGFISITSSLNSMIMCFFEWTMNITYGSLTILSQSGNATQPTTPSAPGVLGSGTQLIFVQLSGENIQVRTNTPSTVIWNVILF